MSVKIYELISNIGFISAGIMLILSVTIFIKFKIPKVYANLSGVAARREIEGINQKNAQERGRSRKLSPFQYQKGRTSEIMSFTGRMKKTRQPIEPKIPKDTTSANETEVLDPRSYPQPVKSQIDQIVVEEFVVEDDIVFIHTEEIIL